MAIFLSVLLASGFLLSVYRQNALGMLAGHLGSGYANGFSMDRIGNDGGDYEPGDVRARPG
jgi:hypothetical protein